MGFKRYVGGTMDFITRNKYDFDGLGREKLTEKDLDDIKKEQDWNYLYQKKLEKDREQQKKPGNNKRKTARDRHKPHPMRMGYPLSRGQSERTGDSLMIKCFEYVPSELGIDGEKGYYKIDKAGQFAKQNYGVGERLINKDGKFVTGIIPGTGKIINQGASNNIGKDPKKMHYYIELPIPQDINDSNTVTWGDDNMNIFQLAGLAAANKFIENPGVAFDTIRKQVVGGFINEDNPSAGILGGVDEQTQNAVRAAISGKAISALGQRITANSALGRAEGMILNSNLELLFSAVNLRSFPFSINFSPRSPDEARMVKHIIRALKMSMAAKKSGQFVEAEGQGGVFLRSPDVFQLQYLHNGTIHPFLNNFKACALTGMSVNYTNSGTYTTYADGTPVSIRMNLTFKELNPIYQEDYHAYEENDGLGVGF